jgi:hypothetical protein
VRSSAAVRAAAAFAGNVGGLRRISSGGISHTENSATMAAIAMRPFRTDETLS